MHAETHLEPQAVQSRQFLRCGSHALRLGSVDAPIDGDSDAADVEAESVSRSAPIMRPSRLVQGAVQAVRMDVIARKLVPVCRRCH